MSKPTLSESALRRLEPVLSKFEPSEGGSYSHGIGVPRERFPVPGLPYMVLTQIIGCRDRGTGEKTLWGVPFRYDGHEALLTYEKFGVRLYLTGNGDQELADEIIGKLRAIVKALEQDSLTELAEQKFVNAEVTLLNQHHRLRAAYEHFRGLAEQLLADSEAPDTQELGSLEEGDFLSRGISKHFERLELGSFNAIAAINAYFSWLEHVLTLALAFGDVDPAAGVLKEHIGNRWGDKFRRVFDTNDKRSNQVLGRLHEIAETYRNTFGHGGFDKLGATVGVQFEGVGVIPARLTDVRRSPHFELFPFEPISFGEVTAVLDEVDAFLHETLKLPMRFIEGGFDVPFDTASRREYREAMQDETRFEEFANRRSEEIDRIANMDF